MWFPIHAITRWCGGRYGWVITSHRFTLYPKKYAHGFVVLCFVVVMQSFIMNSHEVSIHIHQGCFAGTGAIVRLPQCQWSKPDGYGKISQCITTTKHSKAKTVCTFLGIYCITRKILGLCPAKETAVFCDDVSHWLGTSLESFLYKRSRRYLASSHTVIGKYGFYIRVACWWRDVPLTR